MAAATAALDRAAALADLSARLLAELDAGRLDPPALAEATGIRMIAATTLTPAPRDPVEHLRVAHAAARRHLERLTAHDPAVEVVSTMTTALFRRLTRPPGEAPGAAPPSRFYTYTPRRVLRRVLDHALDHLNQVDQWLTWRRQGLAPIPTDGWAPVTVTLPEDRLPLDTADLEAWLWRIDQAARLLVERAAALSAVELDWPPPDGGWPLRRVLHHVARSEVAYAGALDGALPGDGRVRYVEATRRLTRRLVEARERGADDAIVYVDGYGTLSTPAAAVDEVLAVERALLGDT
jgi:hypothetical protein